MPAQKLGGRMHHNICPVLNRAHQVRRAEGVIHYQWQPVVVRQSRQRLDIRNITVRVPQRLDENGAGLRTYRRLHLQRAVHIYKGCPDTISRQRVLQQIVASAVYGTLSHNVSAILRQGLQSVGDGRRPGSHSQGSHAALQGRHSPLEYVLRGIRQPAVYVPGIAQTKAVCRVFTVAEHIG